MTDGRTDGQPDAVIMYQMPAYVSVLHQRHQADASQIRLLNLSSQDLLQNLHYFRCYLTLSRSGSQLVSDQRTARATCLGGLE